MILSFLKILLPLIFAQLSRVYCQESGEICLFVPRGPVGPAGPQGPPGDALQCSCNITDLEDKLQFQQDRLARTSNIENETAMNFTDVEEIKEIFNEEWRRKNNCPVGISDDRIPDSDITASSVYTDSSYVYGAHLARLDNQPRDGSIGAWRAYDVPSIGTITCGIGFYTSASSSTYSSTSSRRRRHYSTGSSSYSTTGSSRFNSEYFSNTKLVQMVQCPEGCGSSGNLYGNGNYTDFSSICRAAIHDGRITNERGGIVTVRRIPRRQYNSANFYLVQSNSYTAQSGSFSFGPNNFLPWLQVDFHTPALLTGVITQGRPTAREEWIETFKILYGNNQTNLATMKHSNGTDIIFSGNKDRTSHVTNMFLEPIRARFVRLVAYSWHEGVSLRLEYLTC